MKRQYLTSTQSIKNLFLKGFFTVCMAISLTKTVEAQTTYTYNSNADAWSTSSNWTGGVPTGGIGDTLDLSNVNLTASRTLTIKDSSNNPIDLTIGKLLIGDNSFNNGSNPWDLTGNGTLTFDNGASDATIVRPSSTNRRDSITIKNIKLNSNLKISSTVGSALDPTGLTISSAISAGTAETKTITNMGSGASPLRFTGVISDGTAGGKVALSVESASSTTYLSGENTYTGATTVSPGAMLLLKGGGKIQGSLVTVSKGGTFGGNGTVTSLTTLNNTSGNTTDAPVLIVGESSAVGTLNLFGGLTATNGFRYYLDFTDLAASPSIPTSNDLIDLGTGSFTGASALGSPIELVVNDLRGTTPTNYTTGIITIMTGTGTWNYDNQTVTVKNTWGATTNYIFDKTTELGTKGYKFETDKFGTTTLKVALFAVPEPSSVLLSVFSILGLLFVYRKRAAAK